MGQADPAVGAITGRLVTRVVAASVHGVVQEAARRIAAGDLVAFPTDTVYGLGCDLRSPDAIERLYAAKERPRHLAIPVLVASPDEVRQVAADGTVLPAALVARFWPGALTVVVPSRSDLPAALTAGQRTVAVRMPDHALALRLIEAAGGALAVTSANVSGRPSPETAERVLADLDGRIALLIDGGRAAIAMPSSIVDLSVQPPRLLRSGHLPLSTLREVLADLVAE